MIRDYEFEDGLIRRELERKQMEKACIDMIHEGLRMRTGPLAGTFSQEQLDAQIEEVVRLDRLLKAHDAETEQRFEDEFEAITHWLHLGWPDDGSAP